MTSHATTPSTLDLVRNRSRVFERIQQGEDLGATLHRSLAAALVGSAIFGLALGSYAQTWPQVLASMIKVPLLLLGTAALCFPSFHVFQTWRGPRPLSLAEAAALQAASLAAVALIWGCLAPPLVFLVGSTHHYHLSQTLALTVGGLGGLVGLGVLLSGYRVLCRPRSGEPGSGSPGKRFNSWFLAPYFLVFAAVGGQLAWMLRPFIGSPQLPFQLFRPADPTAGNLFTLIHNLLGG